MLTDINKQYADETVKLLWEMCGITDSKDDEEVKKASVIAGASLALGKEDEDLQYLKAEWNVIRNDPMDAKYKAFQSQMRVIVLKLNERFWADF